MKNTNLEVCGGQAGQRYTRTAKIFTSHSSILLRIGLHLRGVRPVESLSDLDRVLDSITARCPTVNELDAVVKDGNRDKIKYSIHDARTSGMLCFLQFLDNRRAQPKPWLVPGIWPQRFSVIL